MSPSTLPGRSWVPGSSADVAKHFSYTDLEVQHYHKPLLCVYSIQHFPIWLSPRCSSPPENRKHYKDNVTRASETADPSGSLFPMVGSLSPRLTESWQHNLTTLLVFPEKTQGRGSCATRITNGLFTGDGNLHPQKTVVH